jgi:hypothetical protein
VTNLTGLEVGAVRGTGGASLSHVSVEGRGAGRSGQASRSAAILWLDRSASLSTTVRSPVANARYSTAYRKRHAMFA